MFKYHQRILNVPYRLVKRFCKTKVGMELLVFAVCLKRDHGRSGMYLTNEYAVMKFLHCSQSKARRIIAGAKECRELFRYNPKTKFIQAKSFRLGATVINDKFHYGNRLYGDECIKLRFDDERISHYDTLLQMQNKIFLRQSYYEASSGNSKSRMRTCPEVRKTTMTQKHLATLVACHQTTVSRRMRKLASPAVNKIEITSHPKIMVKDLIHNITYLDCGVRKPFISGTCEYIRDVNDYKIKDNDINNSYGFVIWNHPKRIHLKLSKYGRKKEPIHNNHNIQNPWDNANFH